MTFASKGCKVLKHYSEKTNKNKGKYLIYYMEKNIEISILLDIYGSLLTDKQFEMLNDYYNNDYSLAEIAENYSITRQAVRDDLKKGEKKLYNFEEKLHLRHNRMVQEEHIATIITEISKINGKMSDEKIQEIIKSVKFDLQRS